MDPVTATLLIKTLDGLSARAQVTSQNIANANTPNYRPMRVTFEAALAAAAPRGEAAINAVEPKIEEDSPVDSQSGVRLDLELANASTTAMRYAAIAELLSRGLQMGEMGASGNG